MPDSNATVVEGVVVLSNRWSLRLPVPFSKRQDGEDVVLWRPEFTIWMSEWGAELADADAGLERIRDEMPGDAVEEAVERDDDVIHFGYSLVERRGRRRMHVFHGFVLGSAGEAQLAMYLKRAEDLELARAIWRSLGPIPLEV